METLNGYKVRLTLNTNSHGDQEFFYEFTYTYNRRNTLPVTELTEREDTFKNRCS